MAKLWWVTSGSNIFILLPVPHYTVLRPPPRHGKNGQTHLEDNGEKSTVLYVVAAVRATVGRVYISAAQSILTFLAYLLLRTREMSTGKKGLRYFEDVGRWRL